MFLASCGLMGKLHLTSEMTEKEVEDEIHCVFKVLMNNDCEFHFQYLQATGGGTKF